MAKRVVLVIEPLELHAAVSEVASDHVAAHVVGAAYARAEIHILEENDALWKRSDVLRVLSDEVVEAGVEPRSETTNGDSDK